MLQLQSFSQMFIVFLTAPLGIIGVVIALLVTRAPLGFVAILGIVALSGMIMRNSVILINQIRAEMEEGLDPWNAVVEAAVHRTRPVRTLRFFAGQLPLKRCLRGSHVECSGLSR